MKELFTSFGTYNLRSRISVGIIFLAPIILNLYLCLPEICTLSSTTIILVISYCMCNILIIYCRIPGVKAMKKCFPNLLPAQEALLPSSKLIDSRTKQRYYTFLSNHISDFEIYENDEKMISNASTAITWLIAQTRDCIKFPLIAEENSNFGFSYNLLGLKPYGIIISVAGLMLQCILLILNHQKQLGFDFQLLIACAISYFLFLLLWIFIVSKKLVISSGKKYARALLSACDSEYLN